MSYKAKLVVYLLLLAYTEESFSACEDLKQQVSHYETACSLSTGLGAGCGALTAVSTPFIGPFGLFFALPGFVASGICILRDWKKKHYLACVEGHGEPWQKLILKVDPKYAKQAQDRLNKMMALNELYEQELDTFINGCKERGVDVTLEENFEWLKAMLLIFEDEYVSRAKEIDREYMEATK